MVENLTDIPKGASVQVVLEEEFYLNPYKGEGEGKFVLTKQKSKYGPFKDFIGQYFGQPIHPKSHLFAGGLENVVLISPFMDENFAVRIAPSQIQSYVRVGSLRELTFSSSET